MTDNIESSFFSNNFRMREGVNLFRRMWETFEDKEGQWLFDWEAYYMTTEDTLAADDDPDQLYILTLHEMDGTGGFTGSRKVFMYNASSEASEMRITIIRANNLLRTADFHKCSECKKRIHKADFAMIYGQVYLCPKCHGEASQNME